MYIPLKAALFASLTLLIPASALAQRYPCVPGNPLYDHGDYRCFGERPHPTHARSMVTAHVEAARYLSGSTLTEGNRQNLEDHFDGLSDDLARSLPSLVDGDGALHTPDVRIAVVLLPSGNVGRVRVLSRHGNTLDRRIAQTLAEGISQSDGVSVDQSEVEVIVRLRPRLRYTHWRAVRHGCCIEDSDE
jgi:hypothetical protein